MVNHSSHERVYTAEEIKRAWQLIKKSDTITLLAHKHPDADTVSACAALSYVLKSLGKQIESIYPTALEMPIKRQPEAVLINRHIQVPDLLIVCDTANYERFYYPQEFNGIPLINIDHHISNSIDATFNFVAPDTSSTCELLSELLVVWAPEMINKQVAQCLLFGMLSDTQVFRLSSVTSKTLRIAADLMDKGASTHQLITELVCHKNPKIVALWGHIMKNITITPNKKAAWVRIDQALLKGYQLEVASLVGFSNFLSEISEIDVTILFYQTKDGKTKVSLRSKKTDVNILAKEFGGGGHIHASGILSDLPIDELKNKLVKKLW